MLNFFVASLFGGNKVQTYDVFLCPGMKQGFKGSKNIEEKVVSMIRMVVYLRSRRSKANYYRSRKQKTK